MSALGDLLELIHGAPRRYRSLDATVTLRGPGSQDTADVHLPFPARDPDESSAPLTLVEGGPEELAEEAVERYMDELVKDIPPPEENGERYHELWDPTLLLTNFWLEPDGEAKHLGRHAIRVRATERDSGDDYGRLGIKGDHELLIDKELGVVLHAESLAPGRERVWNVVALDFDRPATGPDERSPAPEGTGDILELLYTAKRRFSTIHATIREKEHWQRAGEDRIQVWFHSRWRWRCERESRGDREIEIAGEDRFWRVIRGELVESETEDAGGFRGWWEVPFEELWDGALLIPRLWFEPHDRELLGDHEVLRVRLAPRPASEYWDPGFLDGLAEGELRVDADTGLIRRFAVQGGPFSTFVRELVDAEFDPHLPPRLFVYRKGEEPTTGEVEL